MNSPRRTFSQPQKPFLYPRGTLLADIPAHAKGLTEMEYLDHCIANWKKAVHIPLAVEAAARPQFGSRRKLR
jgi:hypothetical protein